MDQDILDKIMFYGKIVDNLHETLEAYEKNLKEETEPARIKQCKKMIAGFKSTLKHYKASQKILVFES